MTSGSQTRELGLAQQHAVVDFRHADLNLSC